MDDWRKFDDMKPARDGYIWAALYDEHGWQVVLAFWDAEAIDEYTGKASPQISWTSNFLRTPNALQWKPAVIPKPPK